LSELLEFLKTLNLPEKEYAIHAAGPLSVRVPERVAHDLDIIVKKRLWNRLTKKYPIDRTELSGDPVIRVGDIELFKTWPAYKNINKLINTAELINNVPYVQLKHVRQFKKYMNRPKDIADIELIDRLLKAKKPAE